MSRRSSPTLGTQLGIAFGCVIALLGTVELYAWVTLGRSLSESRSLFEDRLLPAIQIHEVHEAYVSTLVREARAVASGRADGVEAAARMAQARSRARTQWEAYKRTYLVPDEVRRVPAVDSQLASIAPIADRLQILAAEHRQGDVALTAWLDLEYLPASGPLLDSLRSLVTIQEREGRAIIQQLEAQERRAVAVGGFVLLGSVGLAALAAYRISRDIGRRAASLVSRLKALAEGAGDSVAPEEEGGDWGRMATDLDRIVERLKAHSAATEILERQARAASDAKSAFVASMTHELRTPLTAILGYARLMARDPGRSTEDARELAHILRAGEHLLTLVNDVLSLARIEAGRLEANARPFEPRALFQDLESMFALITRGHGLRFEVVEEDFPSEVVGDLPKLRQVLVNLVGNAVKFTEKGHVRLEARWSDGRASFAVEDSGPGLTIDEQARLFEAFTQAAAGLAKEGTGLGLHISQALVRSLGGEIRVVSEQNSGSRFSFEIPLAESRLPMASTTTERRPPLEPGVPSDGLTVDARDARDALDALGAQPVEWRRQFRTNVAIGDLEAAEASLDQITEARLRESLRAHLRAYRLRDLLDRLN